MAQCKIRSYAAKTDEVERDWWQVDADGQVLGRLACRIATVLMGKHKPTYTPHVDTGDFVIVTNATQIGLTGNKASTMVYPRYSYHPGGYKETPYERMMAAHPERIIEEAGPADAPQERAGA